MAYQRKTKDLNISPKLQQILTQISHKSDIAKQLLRTKLSKEDLVEDPIDYLSVSKTDPSKISYLQSAKIQKAKLRKKLRASLPLILPGFLILEFLSLLVKLTSC